jgi:hypothetical protein
MVFRGLNGCFFLSYCRVNLEHCVNNHPCMRIVLEIACTALNLHTCKCFEMFTYTHETYWEVILTTLFIMFSGKYDFDQVGLNRDWCYACALLMMLRMLNNCFGVCLYS